MQVVSDTLLVYLLLDNIFNTFCIYCKSEYFNEDRFLLGNVIALYEELLFSKCLLI